MSDIKSWSTLAASNNASVPNGWPEGMAPSGVNDSARELMGAVRRWYDDAQWTDLGHTPTYVSTLTFTLAGDMTGIYTVGRRIRAKVGSSTYYGTVDSSTYTAATGIYTSLDSGGFTASLSAIAVGILTPTNWSFPKHLNITVGTLSASEVISPVISTTNLTASTISASNVTTLALTTSTINENTADAGVTIDGLLVKDSVANMSKYTSFVTEYEASATISASISLGTVTTGDRIFVSIATEATMSGANPQILVSNLTFSGTATGVFGHNHATMTNVAANPTSTSVTNRPHTSGIFRVTGDGTLAFNLEATFAGIGVTITNVNIYAYFLKKA